ncbi:integral membrane protein [Macrophomina phaseolina MS6]|uniref:Integral membrane protein n=1 Tax=Macrophomina phaseolina (strain MS6) TaxID=1126212 RepID=K2S9Z8_MACPH|nr:integral membrane protein [Macrophomina phaseolina MS6]
MLYSRLHLVTSNERMIRCVLLMIITNVCILHFPTTVLFFGSNLASPKPFVKPFIVYEKIQLMGFCIQESIISALYIWETIHVLRPVLTIKGPRERTVIWHLVFVNGLVVLLDVSLVATEYTNHFDIQTTYKPVVYSIKLKMEFIVLNRLLSIIQGRSGTRSCCRGSCCYAIARPTLYRSNGLSSMAIQSSSDHTDIKPPSTAKLNPCSMPLPEPPEQSAGTACVDMHRELVETESIELLRYHAQMGDLRERGGTDTQAQYGALRFS